MNVGDLFTLARTHTGALVNRTWTLPIAAVSPTSRCHSRCVSCDWWRASGRDDLAVQEYARVAEDLAALGTRLIVLTGGEPLLRDDVWDIAELFRSRGMVVHLLTSGLAIGAHIDAIARHCAQVVISLDGATAEQYRTIRGVDGFDAIARGVVRMREAAPHVRVRARATLHRLNFMRISDLVVSARHMGVQQVSFLAADVTSSAFRPHDVAATRGHLALTAAEVDAFREAVERCIHDHAEAFAIGFVAESPAKLRRLPDYYAALNGSRPFHEPRCNAPWVSIVIEGDGAVRPCFFQPALGNVTRTRLVDIVSRDLRQFRVAWRPEADAVCERCVCALTLGWRTPPWA